MQPDATAMERGGTGREFGLRGVEEFTELRAIQR